MSIRIANNIYTLSAFLLVLMCNCKEQAAQQQLPPPDIQVMQVIQQDVPLQRDFVGQVYGLQDVPIRARVEGYLRGIHFEEGRPVKKGQLLYTIDSQPFEAEVASMQNKVAEAHTYLVNAESELERYKPLAEINAVSKSDLDRAQASRDAAEASWQAAQANLRMAQINLSYCSIHSPINGLIGKTQARAGEFVGRDPNPVILNEVSRVDSIRIEFFLTEAEYLVVAREFLDDDDRSNDYKPKDKENLTLILADGSVYDHRGTVEFVDRNVDPSTGSLLIQASFPNPRRLLRPGMFARVRVDFEIVKDGILVPQRCVKELQGQYSVYVVGDDNVVQERQVEATSRIGDMWLISSGLSAQDKVVIEGMQQVATGMPVNPVVTEYKSQTQEQG
jgi:membrane fusion protein (multidrug efflux system)